MYKTESLTGAQSATSMVRDRKWKIRKKRKKKRKKKISLDFFHFSFFEQELHSGIAIDSRIKEKK